MNTITSEMLINLKNQTGLTIEEIAREAGVPLGTAQKIFAGITKNPRHSAATALYSYLSGVTGSVGDKERFSFAPDGRESAGIWDGVLEEPGIAYGIREEEIRRPSFRTPRPFIHGNLARTIRKPGEYTVEDYRNLPDDCRCELIDGFFFDMASPSTSHQITRNVLQV